PPNLNREHFGFMNWKTFDKNLFAKVKGELISKQKKITHKIIGNDLSPNSIELAEHNAKAANVFENIELKVGDFKNFAHNLESGIIITNPPYDERIKQENINEFYKEFGDTLKNNFAGFDAWILSANLQALKSIGLRTSKRIQLFNGALETKFYNYKLYKGSLKAKYDK
ncbi:MAG: class I SAM-dependent RNA methyltransferase, partial [Ignavibacteriae bacterium]|nr:class I SAM-dependent RNA methyltransferase [Ignavibacteriota bacterium]